VVKIRLQRRGRKKAPVYKIVAADSRSPRDGRFIEALGQYAPLEKPARIEINAERALYWLKVGAQPTDTARSLLSDAGLMLQFHLMRKGKSEEEIQTELEKWSKEKEARRKSATSKKERRAIKKAESEQSTKEAAPAAVTQPEAETAPVTTETAPVTAEAAPVAEEAAPVAEEAAPVAAEAEAPAGETVETGSAAEAEAPAADATEEPTA
jgi:small subunit ribosomal protein S16